MMRYSLKENERADYVPPDTPYLREKIIADFRSGDCKEHRVFNGMKEAVAFTRIRPGYIKRCIDTGCRWGGWIFDIE